MSETIKQLKWKLTELKNVNFHPDVMAARDKVLSARKSEIELIESKLKELRGERKVPVRWPEHTPKSILDACDMHWSGTVEWYKYRIHIWNECAVWTSYPSGGYSNNMGWQPAPCCYELVSLVKTENVLGKTRGTVLDSIRGRASKKDMESILLEKTGKPPQSNF